MGSKGSFCDRLPKLELHAHLNGCISKDILSELEELGLSSPHGDVHIREGNGQKLNDCFTYFDRIHKAVRSLDAVRIITRRVIESFDRNGVVYLELRTTPKGTDQFTKIEYINEVCEEIETCNERKDLIIQTRLILSIDRARDLSLAEETVRISKDLWKKKKDTVFVGIDVSGNPFKGTWSDFSRILNDVREVNIPVTVHFAERDVEEENRQILDFNPDRIGHAVFVNEQLVEMMKDKQIPLEICLTSNVRTLSVDNYSSHLLAKKWVPMGYPVCVCTDDSGLFETSLSQELEIAQEICKMSDREMYEMMRKSIDFIFDRRGETKQHLLSIFEQFQF